MLLPVLVLLIIIFSGTACYSQPSKLRWQRETNLPAESIFSLRMIGDRMYAGADSRMFVGELGKKNGRLSGSQTVMSKIL